MPSASRIDFFSLVVYHPPKITPKEMMIEMIERVMDIDEMIEVTRARLILISCSSRGARGLVSFSVMLTNTRVRLSILEIHCLSSCFSRSSRYYIRFDVP
jgi:hypothetical protein